MSPEDEPLKKFIDLKVIAAGFNNCHTKTIKRLAASDPDFPKLTMIGNRWHAVEHEVENYKRVLVARNVQPRLKSFPVEHSFTNKNRKVAAP